MLRSINSKFYMVSFLLIFSFIAGYTVLAYFRHQQNRSVVLARDVILLEHDIATLSKYVHEIRFWEQVTFSANTPEAARQFTILLQKIRDNLISLKKQQLNTATKVKLTQVDQAITLYESFFNKLMQLKTQQHIQETRMETNYRSIVSIILNTNTSSLLKPLFNFTHFLISYRSKRDSIKYQALKLVIESFETQIKTIETMDSRMLYYLQSFKSLLDNNHATELEVIRLKKDAENVFSQLQGHFSDISLDSNEQIQNKLKEIVIITKELQRTQLVFVFFGVIIVLLILRHLSKGIVHPIKILSQTAQEVQEGNIHARFKTSVEADEIVQLGLSFNNMLETLSVNNKQLLSYQHELENKIKELSKREAEGKRLTAKIQSIEKMEAIGTLAGGVAHDLNNILSGVVSYPELLLLDMPEDSPYRKPLTAIQESGKQAAAIVQDLLTLARRGVTVTDVTNLNILVSNYLATPEYNKLKSFHSRVDLKVNLSAKLHNITGSPVHLTKTIMNLITNGLESIFGTGTVFIKTFNKYLTKPINGYNTINKCDYAVLQVSDTGIGIPEDNIDRIFEPFYTSKELGRSGTGLGLAVVWGTVQDHNGYVEVRSAKKKGTIFTLYFPATKKKFSNKDSSTSINEYLGKGQTILVIDDSLSQREIASGMLKKLGYSVSTVDSGEEAILYLKGTPVDILILDMIMPPGIDGLETYTRILKFNPKQKAIITSGYSETTRVREAQKKGATTYIRKPYTLEEIGVALKKALNQ